MMKDILYEKVLQSTVEKEYDPGKATRLAEWSSADHSGSLRNDIETLYVTADGGYFILYEGGLYSRFHELPEIATWFGGTYTRPVSVEDALAWCQETGNYDAITDHFPFFLLSVRNADSGPG
jgi:hypothetical protein